MIVPAAVLDALALISPIECGGCGAPDRALCAACARVCAPNVSQQRLADGTPVWAGLAYEGAARRVILSLKEHDRTDLGRPLGRAIAASITRALEPEPPPVAIVPVPASRSSLARRGYDPVSLLLKRARVRPSRVLRSTGARSVQKALDIEARKANRAGAFASRYSLEGSRVILVDDVLTTGATLLDAARAIRDARGEVIGAAVLAFTPKRLGALELLGDLS